MRQRPSQTMLWLPCNESTSTTTTSVCRQSNANANDICVLPVLCAQRILEQRQWRGTGWGRQLALRQISCLKVGGAREPRCFLCYSSASAEGGRDNELALLVCCRFVSVFIFKIVLNLKKVTFSFHLAISALFRNIFIINLSTSVSTTASVCVWESGSVEVDTDN